jgi:hypothetical protein
MVQDGKGDHRAKLGRRTETTKPLHVQISSATLRL